MKDKPIEHSLMKTLSDDYNHSTTSIDKIQGQLAVKQCSLVTGTKGRKTLDVALD